MESTAANLERLIPDGLGPEDVSGRETLEYHLERYEFAARHAAPGRALDMACGVGYGTRLLVDRRQDLVATGVDLASDAIAYARDRYACQRVRFVQSDAMVFEAPEPFDTVVSLETIEHVSDPQALFGRLVGLVRPGGRLISSVPTTPSVDLNPHHLHDFTRRSFRELASAHGLVEEAELPQVQRMNPFDLVSERRFKRENLRPNLPGYYLRHPDALVRRIAATLRHGLANHYLTLAWTRPG